MKFKNPLLIKKIYSPAGKNILDMILEILLYATCFFPFVQIVYIGTDTQPYGLLISMVIVLLYIKRKPYISRAFGTVVTLSILMSAFAVVMFIGGNAAASVRSYFTYVTLIFVPFAVSIILEKNGGLNEPLVKIAIWIWFLFGFIQKYIRADFGYNLTARHTTGGTRGAVSLGSEPSAYGYICIFLLIIVLRFEKYVLFYSVLLLTQIVMFASSSVTLVYIAAYMIFYITNEILQHKQSSIIKSLGIAGIGIAGIFLIATYVPQTNRMGNLVRNLIHQPDKLLKDESIVMRVDAIKYSFNSLYENYFLPYGMSEKKIMSGVGGLFFECGFIAAFILGAIAAIIWKSYPKNQRLFYTAGFLCIMFSSIPFSSPIVGFYLGHCLYEARKQKQEKLNQANLLKQKDREILWYCGDMYRERKNESFMDM